MKRIILIPILAAISLACAPQERLSDYVRPNLGSVHSRWFFYTPAAVPFGMAKLGASTNGSYGNAQGWEAVGYEDSHTSIEGFPCAHEFQVGGIMLMPTTGELITAPGRMDDLQSGWRSGFDKDEEYATAGYYSVVLGRYGIRAELTATSRVGFQRYTFPESRNAHIIFDVGSRLGESGPVRDAMVRMTSPSSVEGWVITEPTYVQKYQPGATVNIYFVAELSRPAESCNAFLTGGKLTDRDQIQGPGAALAVNFPTTAGEAVEVKIGLSFTSVENARLNLITEAAGLNFGQAHDRAAARWEEALGQIRVEGGSAESRIKFYTGLYHALLGRGLASDCNGDYPRNDGTVGRIEAGPDGKPRHNHYNTDAVWGAYWNLNQLWSMAYPEYYADLVNSQLLVYKDAGWLGDGIANSKYVSGVGTNMVSILMAGAYNCGIGGFDTELAYAAALKNELGWDGRPEGAGKMDTKVFVERGYVPYDDSIHYGAHPGGAQFSCSHTLEYSYSAYAVAQWAKQLGKQDDYEKLMDLSRGWERIFDDSLRLIRPRTVNGAWIDHFDPHESWRGFQEGNAMQYTFFVPQDPQALVERIGSDRFSTRLDSIFTVARPMIFGGGKVVNAFSGLQSPYNHGNQPSLHISWLFNFARKPWLTQKWTRLICDEFYGTTGEHGYGYGQDEDQGQLGAWYVLASLGLFDVQGGASANPTFQIGSPQFDRAVITLSPENSEGSEFVILTSGNKPGNCFVQSATLNGEPLDNCWFSREAFHKGGTLRLKMGSEPAVKWGTATTPPYSK